MDAWPLDALACPVTACGGRLTPSHRPLQEPLQSPSQKDRAGDGRWIDDALAEALRSRPRGRVLELGCGAGSLSARLQPLSPQLLVSDYSLRAVLTARRQADGEPAAPAVIDADHLPLQPRSLEALVAAHVIDLMEDTEAFLADSARALRPGGLLALATLAPDLGSQERGDQALEETERSTGFRRIRCLDGFPWVRPHHRRHFEIYLVQVLTAEVQ